MYQVISTFSGIGGSSQGYKQAGLNVLASVEFLDYQARTYRLNHPTTRVYEADIRTLDPLAILADLGLKPGELDILDGSPPCSSFSTAGLVSDGWGKAKSYGNKRQRTDDLFWDYIRFVEAIQPKVFVAENVSGLIKGNSKGHFNQYLQGFKDCGYTVKAKLMNAANYGVPQIRQRVIFIGVRSDLDVEPVFPLPIQKSISVRQAIAGIDVDKNEPVHLTDYRLPMWKTTKPGFDLSRANEKINGKTGLFSKYKNNEIKPSLTLTANCGNDLMHYSEPRRFYTNELKALQSFPVNYKLVGSKNKNTEGIGRSVPPKMMEAIARTIASEILDKISALTVS